MPFLIPISRRLPHQTTLTASLADRYRPSHIRKNDLRLIIALRHAQDTESEIHRSIVELSLDESSSLDGWSQENLEGNVLLIDGEPFTIESSETLKEIIQLHEYVWYAVVNHQLTDLFAYDYKITVMPQYHLRFKEFDCTRRADSVKYRIPDFCVAKYKIRRTPTLSVSSYRILLIVESKPSGRTEEEHRTYCRAAWKQALQQSGILFSQRKDQTHVGIMITIGSSWAFKISPREDALYPEEAQHSYCPSEEEPSSSASDDVGQLRRAVELSDPGYDYAAFEDNLPRHFSEFGTIQSDRKLQIVRKKLLELSAILG